MDSSGGSLGGPVRFVASRQDGAAQGEDGVGAASGPVHAGAFEALGDGDATAGFEHAAGGAETESVEGGIAHALSMCGEVLGTQARLAIEDLDGVGKVFRGEVPDPGGAIGDDHLPTSTIEAAAPGFAQHALGEC